MLLREINTTSTDVGWREVAAWKVLPVMAATGRVSLLSANVSWIGFNSTFSTVELYHALKKIQLVKKLVLV